MSQYVLVMLWIAVIYIISKTVNVYTEEYVCGKKEVRVTRGFAIFCVIPLIWWAATRSQWFFDTGMYVRGFENIPESLAEIRSYMEGISKDKGFYMLAFLIKVLIGNRDVLYLGILATFQLISIALVFRKFSSNYVMAIFLFVATTDYLSWAHNGIRQFMAVTLIFAATELMLKKKYVPLIAIILLASTLHGSALLMLPIVFIVQGRPWNQKTVLAIFVFLLAIIYVDKFTNLLNDVLVDTQYTNVVSDWQEWEDDGTNPIRVLIYAIPTLLSIIGYPYIKEANDPVVNMACNIGIISTMLYCLSAVTSGIFIGRLPIYCSLYATGILLPWELDNIFTKKSAQTMKLLMIMGFVAFYYYQTHFVWGLI